MRNRQRRYMVAALVLFCVAAGARALMVLRPGIWSDEIFSLAMATGHSLEHPAAEADPRLGDYVEAPTPRPASTYRGYVAHESPPASPARVIRATLRSDTSPPLYYLGLHYWTRIAGTSDAALRGLSALWALACFPLIWSAGRRLGGRSVAFAACVLFSLAPVSLYYSTEGRMYSMAWFLVSALLLLSIRLSSPEAGIPLLIVWSITAALGLLTHYFFAFVWVACLIWLWLYPGRLSRWSVLAGALVSVALILPWYLHLPDSLARWRVTAHWLDGFPGWKEGLLATVQLGWKLISGRGEWGGNRLLDRATAAIIAIVALVAIYVRPRRLFIGGSTLLWLCIIAACTGPLLFDVLRQSYTVLIPRYALAAMPAAMLLAGLAVGRLGPRLSAFVLVLIVSTWGQAYYDIATNPPRAWEPFREVGAELAGWDNADDLVIVHSIPSGVLGVSRYIDPATMIASWVGQLGVRQVPADIARLVEGRRRVALIRIHDVGEPAPEEGWLLDHARLVSKHELRGAQVFKFVPQQGSRFNSAADGGVASHR